MRKWVYQLAEVGPFGDPKEVHMLCIYIYVCLWVESAAMEPEN